MTSNHQQLTLMLQQVMWPADVYVTTGYVIVDSYVTSDIVMHVIMSSLCSNIICKC